MNATLNDVMLKLDALERMIAPAPRSEGEGAAHAAGLLSYEDLQDRLTVGVTNPRKPCLRTVKSIVEANRSVIRKVKVSAHAVGFRPGDVPKLLAHLAGEPRLRRQL